jgi:hypothetical protein
MRTAQHRYVPAHTYVVAGILAIVAGGLVSAFMAKQPNTFAMWTSAYLVLVVGVAQVFFGTVFTRLLAEEKTWRIYGIFALFNIANVLVIAGTAIKYAGYDWNIPLTIVGSGLLVVALALLGVCLYGARWSWLKLLTYIVIAVLVLSIVAGLVLAHQ